MTNTEMQRFDDNSDGRYEELKMRWNPTFYAGCYDVQVEFRDLSWNSGTLDGSRGAMNFTSATWAGSSWYHLSEKWLWKYCYEATDVPYTWGAPPQYANTTNGFRNCGVAANSP